MSPEVNLSKWIAGEGPEQDIVLSSRVRLARNIEGFPYPHQAEKEQLEEIIKIVSKAAEDNTREELHFLSLTDLPEIEKGLLVEKNLISPEFIKKEMANGLLLNDSEKISIMINEEDHLRIQILLPGLQLKKALIEADKLDDKLEQELDFAYSRKWGYLSACPTNLGTGLRGSVMVHLPALNMTDSMNRMLEAVAKLGLVVRGIYGEGSKSIGNLYQISNQITMGSKEKDIIDNLKSVTKKIIEQERYARQNLMDNSKIKLMDKINRSLGILKYAHTISGNEAMKLLSNVKLGIDLGIIDIDDQRLFNKLTILIRPYYLQKKAGKKLSSEERDVIRADLLRSKLNR